MSLTDLTDIPPGFGAGGANLSPESARPRLGELLDEHKTAIEELQALSESASSTVSTTDKFTGDGSSGSPLDLNPAKVAIAKRYPGLVSSPSDTLNIPGLNGDSDKRYLVSGRLVINNNGAIKVQPNGSDTDCASEAGDDQTGSLASGSVINLGGQAGAVNVWTSGHNAILSGYITATTGEGWRAFEFTILDLNASGVPVSSRYTHGTWKDDTTPLTSLKFLGGVANIFGAGSIVTLIALGA